MPRASCQIRKIAGCACAGNAGNVFPAADFQGNRQVSYPGMHHGTCVTHVPWCMSGSLTSGGGENVPGIPGACATFNFTYLARGPWTDVCFGELSHYRFHNASVDMRQLDFIHNNFDLSSIRTYMKNQWEFCQCSGVFNEVSVPIRW